MMNDNVNSPKHYTQGDIECIEAIKAATVGKAGIEAFCVGNAIKYLWRYENKNGLEDVKKAAFYVNRLISEIEAKEHKEDTSFDYDFIPDDDGDCCYCVHDNVDIDCMPCAVCKNNFVVGTKEYESALNYFQKAQK